MRETTKTMRAGRRLASALAMALALGLAGGTALAGGDWNDANIGWQSYEKALETAKDEKKPILLVFYTEWCPHCTNYAKVFHDPKVVEQSKKFVMVRLDKDKNAELSKKFAPDGEYIPRTYFLSSAGTLDPDITAARPQYKYFYNESDPASILSGMEAALKKLS